jgi:hypothetical protein
VHPEIEKAAKKGNSIEQEECEMAVWRQDEHFEPETKHRYLNDSLITETGINALLLCMCCEMKINAECFEEFREC